MYAADKYSNKDIGPNSYPPAISLGKQTLSQRHNAVTYKFLQAPKFGRAAKTNNPTSKLKVNLSSLGTQVSASRKTEPLVGFSRGTRQSAQRIQRCMTEKDSAAPVSKLHIRHPNIEMEKNLIGFSGSMASFS